MSWLDGQVRLYQPIPCGGRDVALDAAAVRTGSGDDRFLAAAWAEVVVWRGSLVTSTSARAMGGSCAEGRWVRRPTGIGW